jgi:hypothetical protein
MRYGDRIRIEMHDAQGRSVFGAIDQKVRAPEAGTVGAGGSLGYEARRRPLSPPDARHVPSASSRAGTLGAAFPQVRRVPLEGAGGAAYDATTAAVNDGPPKGG